MKLSDLTPDNRNANKGTGKGQKLIVGSIERSRLGRSIVIDKDNHIVAGNKTVEAVAEVLGVDAELIVVESDGSKLVVHKRTDLDLDDPDPNNPARQLAYADNMSSFFSFELDPEIVMADLEAGFNFETIDISLPDLGDMLEKPIEALLGGNGAGADTEPQITQAEAEKYQEIWQVKSGDVWMLGRHKIACIDSLDREAIAGLIDRSITFVWADPPYGISIVAANGYVGGGEAYDIPFGGVKNGNPRRRGYVGGGSRHKDLTGSYYINEPSKNKRLGSTYGAKPFGKEPKITGSVGASNLIAVGKYFPVVGDDTTKTAEQATALYLELYPDACQVWWGANYYTHVLPPSPGWIVWDKDNTGNFADCEMAWTNQNRAARIFEHRWNGMLKASEQGQRRVHPTQKPIALAQECFSQYGKPDDVIFDPFLGSGPSVLAAENLGDRTVIGCDLVPEYIATILKRF